MIALRRLRQLAVGRRLDFETAVARRVAGTRVVMSDIGLRIDGAAAIDGGLHMHTLSETPVAFEHSVGYVNAVDDDGHTGPATSFRSKWPVRSLRAWFGFRLRTHPNSTRYTKG